MKTFNREQLIEELVHRDLDMFEYRTFASILREGCEGYDNFEERELIEHFLAYVRIPTDENEAFKYVTKLGNSIVVQPVDEAGIKIDGVVEDYQYI